MNGDALEFYLKGEYENLNRNSKSALIEFKKALSLEPNSQIIQKEVANCYMQNNDTLNAKIHYLNALEISKYNLKGKFTLINKDRSRIKVFRPFQNISKPSQSIDAIMISYGSIYKKTLNQLCKVAELKLLKQLEKNIQNY